MIKIPVPKEAARRAIRHFNDEAVVYAWRWREEGETGFVRVYVDPISDSYVVTRQMFRFVQSRTDGNDNELEWTASSLFYDSPEGRWTWDGGAVSGPSLFLILPPSGLGMEDFILRVIGDRKYDLRVSVLDKEEDEQGGIMDEDRIREIVTEEVNKRVVPVQRFWNVKGGFHAYVTDPEEVRKLREEHWREWFDMGVTFYAVKEANGGS